MKRPPCFASPAPADHGDPCPAFAARLSDLIEGACSNEEAARLRRHTEVCPACGRALVLARALRRIVRELGQWEESDGIDGLRRPGPGARRLAPVPAWVN